MADPLYHVTFSKNLPEIQKRGLDPLSASLWRHAGTGERYQDQPSVFSFRDPEEALRWAWKMEWEFRDDISDPSDISIVKLRGGDKWESDPAAGAPDIGKTSMRSLGHIPSSDILDTMGLPLGAGINEEFERQVPGGDPINDWLKFYGNRLRGQGSRPPDPNKIIDLSQVTEQRGLEKVHSDLRGSILEEGRKRSDLSAAHSWNYEIGDRVVTGDEVARGVNPTPWKIIGKYINKKGLLEGSRPREGKFIEGPDVPYYRVSRIEYVGTPEESEVTTDLPEWAIQNKFGTPGLVSDKPSPDEPRPPDQSNLPAVIDAATAASRLAQPPDDEPRPKGLRGGIGALKRAPWFALAQMAWEHLSPEQKEAAAQYGKEAYGSLENAWEAASAWSGRNRFPTGGEGGLQWAMDLLGLGDSPGGILSLPEGDDLTKSRMYGASPGSKPEYLGAGIDRSEYTHLRYPPKDLPEKTQKALDALRNNRNGVKDRVVSMIRRGQQLGGDSWYNTEELRDWFIAELGPERGHDEWREFMNLMGAASTGNKVPSNIAIASMYRSFGSQAAKKLARSHLEEGGDIPSGYGHKQQKNHALNVLNYYEGKWTPTPEEPEIPSGKGSWKKNPKPKGFTASLLGSETNIAADLHFTRIMGMASEDPRYLSNSAEISDTLAQQLKAKYGRKLTTRFLKKNKDGKWKLKARDAVIKGPANLGEFMGEAQVWQGRPDDVEYKAFEQFVNELASELGMTGPQLQANLWMGAADVTGVDPASQGTFMELFRERAKDVGEKTGTPTAEVIRNFIRNRGMFSEGGLVKPGKGGFVVKPLYDDTRTGGII